VKAKRYIIGVIFATLLHPLTVWAQGNMQYKVEAQATAGSGDHNPLWLNANKYGLSSLDKNNGYLRAALVRPLANDSLKTWGVSYGIDLATAYNNTSSFIVQQAFFEGRWRKATLLLGSKELPMEMKNQELSSGSQVLGINARPVPQVRLSWPDYVDVPLTARWLQFKGHLAYGWFTDNGWQKDFAEGKSGYTQDVLFHSKAGFLKVGKPGSPFSAEIGMEMACQFGGHSYTYSGKGYTERNINPVTLKSYFRAFVPSGNDGDDANPDQAYQGADGNHLGAWLARLNYDMPTWAVHVYGEHYFEDLSGMFQLDYDNYTTGSQWMEKHGHRFLLYDFKDMLLGVELNLKRNDWLNNIVVEYVYTKYQSGPIYFDHKKYFPDHLGGRDGYYQHGIYTGWQHWGQVMGNPLYRSPLYNTNGQIRILDNRFYALHLGLSGTPLPSLHYRLLASAQKGFGSYSKPFDNPERNLSLLAEAAYRMPEQVAKGWSLKLGVGYDHGALLGNNFGLQLTIAKNGAIHF
jgi:hypothetical protein